MDAIVNLIGELNHHYDLPKRQIEFGMKKAEIYVNETLKIDVPHAPQLLETFNEKLSKISLAQE